MQRYAAQEQHRKATQSVKSVPDVVILSKLQAAAEQEREQSKVETEKQCGMAVKYGTTIVQVIFPLLSLSLSDLFLPIATPC